MFSRVIDFASVRSLIPLREMSFLSSLLDLFLRILFFLFLVIRGGPWLLAYTDTPLLGDASGVRGDSIWLRRLRCYKFIVGMGVSPAFLCIERPGGLFVLPEVTFADH